GRRSATSRRQARPAVKPALDCRLQLVPRPACSDDPRLSDEDGWRQASASALKKRWPISRWVMAPSELRPQAGRSWAFRKASVLSHARAAAAALKASARFASKNQCLVPGYV